MCNCQSGAEYHGICSEFVVLRSKVLIELHRAAILKELNELCYNGLVISQFKDSKFDSRSWYRLMKAVLFFKIITCFTIFLFFLYAFSIFLIFWIFCIFIFKNIILMRLLIFQKKKRFNINNFIHNNFIYYESFNLPPKYLTYLFVIWLCDYFIFLAVNW